MASSLAMAEYGTSSSTDSRSRRRSSKIAAFSKDKEEPLPRSSNSTDPAEDVLEALGYTPQLARSRSTWAVTFMSFVLASVPYGISTTLIYPLTNGGPATMIWGWVLVCMFMICVAASLGEITSVYPVSGGVYYQTYMLAPPWCRKLTAWLTGWAFVLGNIIITLSVNFATALFLIGCINIFTDADGVSIFPATAWQTYLIFVAVTLICTAVSTFGNRWLPLLDTGAVIMTFVGVLAIICTILAVAKEGRNSAAYAFGGFEVSSGWSPPGWAFCIGLLHAAYATSATGMVVSMCEEVQKPATQVPKALVGAIVLNMICGIIFLVPICFVLKDIAAVVADQSGQPVPAIIRSAVGSEVGAFILCVPLIMLGFFCGIGCCTAASRCTWAFARDGALPGSRRLGFDRVNDKTGIPLNSMLLSTAIQVVLGVIYVGNSAAFNAFNSSGVIFLTLSYVTPVAISLFSGRKSIKQGKFDLGWVGAFCNVVSIGWCLFAIPLFSMPSALPVDAESMNYCSVVFVGGLTISFVWYYAGGRKNYNGPTMDDAEGGAPPRI
ncbi:amino acid permease [Lecanosticta acicola]|uniref:Amino acid permease n=1 Tax=Lecanosticta acicola TaxID=111012 RepID=A0AAI8Z1U6_9PEZI|nr:amino acid permease [Lecanosticta acicola]